MAAARIPVKSRPTRANAEPEARVNIIKDGTLEAIAEYINEGKAKNIIVMSGAGISTAAGIKDFRSPGTGLYDDLERFNLPYPEAVFDISFFKDNPSPFFRLAKELLPGRYRPTFTHYLLPLLAKKGLLLRSYTQNIDMLERLAGIDPELLVEAHGSFANSECIECEIVSDSTWVRKYILEDQIPYCPECGGLVKPTITFFGESLPDRFGNLALVDFKKCDLLIVIGTSLLVEPFNRLITKVSPRCPRLLINRDRAGEDMHSGFDFDDKWKYTIQRDALYLGSCDEGVRKLAKLCGWEGELQAMFEAGNIEMQLAEEMEALALAKELGGEEEVNEDKDIKETKQDQTVSSKKKEAEALDEITVLLESTEISSAKDTTSSATTTTTTIISSKTTIVATPVDEDKEETKEEEEEAKSETKAEKKKNEKEKQQGAKAGSSSGSSKK